MGSLRRHIGVFFALWLLGSSSFLTAADLPSGELAKVAAGGSCGQELNELATSAKYFPRTRRVFGIGWQSLQSIHGFLQAQPRLWNHVSQEPNWGKKPLRLYQDWFHPVIRFLSPLWLPRANTPTFSIFKKLWRNRDYTPTDEEWAILDRYSARKNFETKKAFMARHPYWTAIRKGFGRTLETARIATLILALNLMHQQIEGGTPNVDQYLSQPQYALAPNQVRILNDLVPFPHAAIQIGDRVYSYGQTHLSRSTVNEYLRNRQIRKLVEAERIRRGEPEPIDDHEIPRGSSATVRQFGGALGEAIIKTLGLDKLPQSLQAVTLNLTEAEVKKLQRYFEMQVGKQYPNATMVNDCATMGVRALQENTSLQISGPGDFIAYRAIDASPSQLSLYFAARKSLGAKWVGPIYQITVEEESHPHLLRNSYINVLESKVFIDLVVFNQVNRLYIDAVYDSESLQFHDAVTKQVLADFRAEYVANVNADKQIRLWETLKIPLLHERSVSGQDVEASIRTLSASMNHYFDEKIAEADAFLELTTLERLDILKYEVIKRELELKRLELTLKLAQIQKLPMG